MNVKLLTEVHREAALAAMRDRSLFFDPLARADQLVVGMRHLICCWALSEATEDQLIEVSAQYSTVNINGERIT